MSSLPPDFLPPSHPHPSGETTGLRQRLWRIIFLSDTFAGRMFDVVLLGLIALCVLVVMLESIEPLRLQHPFLFRGLEWGFTIIFTIEYGVRLAVVRNRRKYATSFFGIIDLVSILPSYLELLFSGSHYLMTIRVLRLLRMFRILKMAEHVGESHMLLRALRASRNKIIVFLVCVVAIVCVEGTMMYVIEHSVNPGFANIPQAIYWAIVTLTTVGFGDVTPVTVAGKMMACIVMLTGFAIIAVPTGVVTSEMSREFSSSKQSTHRCVRCGNALHQAAAKFCHQCGEPLSRTQATEETSACTREETRGSNRTT